MRYNEPHDNQVLGGHVADFSCCLARVNVYGFAVNVLLVLPIPHAGPVLQATAPEFNGC